MLQYYYGYRDIGVHAPKRKWNMKKKLLIAIALLAIITLVGLAGCSLLTGNSADTAANNSTKNVTTYTDVSQSELESALTRYREIAENLSTRVTELEELVRQSIMTSKSNIGGYATVYVNSVLNLTCSEPGNGNVSSSGGTGFIITEDGYVLTNNHVVAYELSEIDYDNPLGRNLWGQIVYGTKTTTHTYSSVTATFDAASDYTDSATYTLTVVYRDPAYDLALCKLTESAPVGDSWKPIPFYEGAVVRGDELLLLGNARGFGLSATSGLVSATGKTFADSPQLTFLQTDAAINGGNSGGPAINIYGGLVGVVNSKFVSTNIENMGFAIELDKVKTFIAAAQTNQSVTVTYKTVSATNANAA